MAAINARNPFENRLDAGISYLPLMTESAMEPPRLVSGRSNGER